MLDLDALRSFDSLYIQTPRSLALVCFFVMVGIFIFFTSGSLLKALDNTKNAGVRARAWFLTVVGAISMCFIAVAATTMVMSSIENESHLQDELSQGIEEVYEVETVAVKTATTSLNQESPSFDVEVELESGENIEATLEIDQEGTVSLAPTGYFDDLKEDTAR